MSQNAAVRLDDSHTDHLTVEVVERRDFPGAWGVEAINYVGDGEIYVAVFHGPEARARAYEYAGMKYGVG